MIACITALKDPIHSMNKKRAPQSQCAHSLEQTQDTAIGIPNAHPRAQADMHVYNPNPEGEKG